MSKYKNYWYGIVKKLIGEYRNLNVSSPMEKRFLNAINLTLSQMNQQEREIVVGILIDKAKSIPEVAKECNRTKKEINLIVSDFVNEVGLLGGFKTKRR